MRVGVGEGGLEDGGVWTAGVAEADGDWFLGLVGCGWVGGCCGRAKGAVEMMMGLCDTLFARLG